MGDLSNTNNVTTAAIAANDENDTPTHWRGYREQALTNELVRGTLIDADTDVAPVFDVAVGATLTFAAGDFSFPVTPGAGQQEALYTDVLDTGAGGFNMWIKLYTGSGNADAMDLAPFNIDNWTYDES